MAVTESVDPAAGVVRLVRVIGLRDRLASLRPNAAGRWKVQVSDGGRSGTQAVAIPALQDREVTFVSEAEPTWAGSPTRLPNADRRNRGDSVALLQYAHRDCVGA